MAKKIIDCFIFYNELNMLSYRLKTLFPYVDKFVIVESKYTFAGKPKELYFLNNRNKYAEYLDKIIHIVLDDALYVYPNINYNTGEQWLNEYYQRNAIHRGIQLYQENLTDNDWIIVSDVDEIVDPKLLEHLLNNYIEPNVYALEMDFYYYNIETKFLEKWYLAKILSYANYKELDSCQQIRNLNCNIVKNGGWHLSYFGNSAFIKNKIENFSHQELNLTCFTNIENIDNRIQSCSDLFDRNNNPIHISIENNNYLPPNFNMLL